LLHLLRNDLGVGEVLGPSASRLFWLRCLMRAPRERTGARRGTGTGSSLGGAVPEGEGPAGQQGDVILPVVESGGRGREGFFDLSHIYFSLNVVQYWPRSGRTTPWQVLCSLWTSSPNPGLHSPGGCSAPPASSASPKNP
jgi:hypothetical protein